MVGEIRVHKSRACYRRKCKTERGPTNIDSLPDELLLEILARLPADDLHYEARVVCRRWCHLIHSDYFIKTQLHHSTYGLFMSFYDQSTFVSATQGRIETSEISHNAPPHTKLLSSCNGLVLQDDEPMRIINPVIRRQLVLPSLSCEQPAKLIYRRGSIGYAADSMEYKVVLPYRRTDMDQEFLGILSVGSDKSWRHVGVEHLSETARNHLGEFPLVTEGFIIWIDFYAEWYLKLDVETEILTAHPSLLQEACLVGTYLFYLSTGRSLSLLAVDKYTKYLIQLWEMKAESGEWRKVVGDIKLGAHERWLQQFSGFLMPLGWVRYPEVLALYFFNFGNTCIFFNLNTQQISSMELPGQGLNTQQISSMELPGQGAYWLSHAHKKSLAWFS